MARIYVWASILVPLLGMLMSMISHRYAYMNAAVGLGVFFVLTAFVHVKTDLARSVTKDIS